MDEMNSTGVEKVSDRELEIRRVVDGPANLVFKAWTEADLFRKWWVPKSFGLELLSCEMDARVGGEYRLVFPHEGSTMEFFGTYVEVVPDSKLVWTNDEGEGQTITTVTFEEQGGKTVVTVRDVYPSEEAMQGGSMAAMPESFDQLDELLAQV